MTTIKHDITEYNASSLPAKIASFAERALARGLTVAQNASPQADDTAVSLVISSSNPIDEIQVWLFYRPGRNGGTLNTYRYSPYLSGHRKRPDQKITHFEARVVIDGMGDALARHKAREAAKVTTLPKKDSTDETVAAQAIVRALRPNAKFALRVAKNGRIPTNTPAKLRVALLHRGLILAAGGALTDLGRAARAFVLT